MAFVDGHSLARRLATQGRYEDPRQAAALVRQVAEALAAVHDRGIVHRDLKPGNILLDAAGQALLTDFGLARPEDDDEHLTVDGHLIGTPAYMAPEQARPVPGAVGIRSDLYSLGVVLYQMLSGRVPFDGPLMNVVNQVAQETPPALSQLRADLDPALVAIVERAMARKPEERYPNAAAFAAALEQWMTSVSTVTLEPRPVEAAPIPAGQSVIEAGLPDGGQVKVLVQHGATPPSNVTVKIHEEKSRGPKRRKRLVISVSVTLILLLVLAPLVWVEMRSPRAAKPSAQGSLAVATAPASQRDKQVVERDKATEQPQVQVKEELKQPLEKWITAEDGRREKKDKALPKPKAPAPEAPSMNVGSPQAEMALAPGYTVVPFALSPGQNSFQVVARSDGQLVAAARQPTRRQVVSEYLYERASVPTARVDLGLVAKAAASFQVKEAAGRAELQQRRGQAREAVKDLEQAIELAKRTPEGSPLTTAVLQSNMAEISFDLGEYRRTAVMYQRSLKDLEKQLGAANPYVAQNQANLAGAYCSMGDYPKAEQLYQQAVRLQREQLGPDHPEVAASLNNLAVLYHVEGRLQQAEPLYRRSLAIYQKHKGEEDTVAQELNNLGLLAASQGRAAATRRTLAPALAACGIFSGPDRLDTAGGLRALAAQAEAQASLVTARRYCDEALAIRERLVLDRPSVLSYREDLAASYTNRGFLARQTGQREEARAAYERALELRQRLLQSDPRNARQVRALAQSHANLAALLDDTGRWEEAATAYQKAVALQEQLVTDSPAIPAYQRELEESLTNLAQVYAELGKRTEASQTRTKAHAIRARLQPASPKR
jgi:tetratricopeptide (TPR) repeat protein